MKSLCYFKLFCKKDRELQYKRRAESLFEDNLDIRSFVKLQASLALMQSLFLTTEQALLFRHNRARVISSHLVKEEKSSSSDNSSMKQRKINGLKKEMKTDNDKLIPKSSQLTLSNLVGLPVYENKINQQLLEGILKSKQKSSDNSQSLNIDQMVSHTDVNQTAISVQDYTATNETILQQDHRLAPIVGQIQWHQKDGIILQQYT